MSEQQVVICEENAQEPPAVALRIPQDKAPLLGIVV